MKEINVTAYKNGLFWHGVNQADSTILCTTRDKNLLLNLIRRLIQDLGDNCRINYLEKEGRLIESQFIKIKKPKRVYKYNKNRIEKITKHVARSHENKLKFKREKK